MNYAKLDFNIDCGLTQNAVRGLDYAGRYTPTGAMSFYKKLRIQYEGDSPQREREREREREKRERERVVGPKRREEQRVNDREQQVVKFDR